MSWDEPSIDRFNEKYNVYDEDALFEATQHVQQPLNGDEEKIKIDIIYRHFKVAFYQLGARLTLMAINYDNRVLTFWRSKCCYENDEKHEKIKKLEEELQEVFEKELGFKVKIEERT